MRFYLLQLTGTERRLGYDTEMTRAVVSKTTVPVIASGGCGKISDFAKILKGPNAADADSCGFDFSLRGIDRR